MANNVMWLQCRCGAIHQMAKSYGAQWETREHGGVPYREALDRWFEEHVTCGGEPHTGDHFHIAYEVGEPKVEGLHE